MSQHLPTGNPDVADRVVLLGGWAIPPRILDRFSGPETMRIDVNELMPSLVTGGKLRADWESAVADIVNQQAKRQPFGIVGWSTGALMAYAAAKRLKPQSVLFISATPSFCRRPGFPVGQRPAVLKAMREKLLTEPEEVLRKFNEQCGIGVPIVSPLGPLLTSPRSPLPQGEGTRQKERGIEIISGIESNYSKEVLVDGLHFLEQASVLPVTPLPCPALFMHGREDAIVPVQAGRLFARALGAELEEYEGGHAFFYRNE